jgi:hypothetical protein
MVSNANLTIAYHTLRTAKSSARDLYIQTIEFTTAGVQARFCSRFIKNFLTARHELFPYLLKSSFKRLSAGAICRR